MNCPNCQTQCGEHDIFCFRCGTRLHQAPSTQKGTHWIPLLIVTLLSLAGICLFWLIPMTDRSADVIPEVPADPWFSVQNGILYFDSELYTGGSELTVPESVNGQTVTQLSSDCFNGCDALTTVILPDTLKVIGIGAFEGCSSIRGIYIPEGVHTICQNAFSGCESLEAITIPSTVTSIGSETFSGCSKLYHIFYSGTFEDWRSLYDEKITLRTQVYCEDGSFLHR